MDNNNEKEKESQLVFGLLHRVVVFVSKSATVTKSVMNYRQ